MGRPDIQQEILKVECPQCSAPKNRRCVRLTNPRKGTPAQSAHQSRTDRFLEYEREQNPPLASMPPDQLKAEQPVRCQTSGRFGRLAHVHLAEQPAVLITWDNGTESRLLLKNADTILHWRERPLLQ